jgi:hypothetical protein
MGAGEKITLVPPVPPAPPGPSSSSPRNKCNADRGDSEGTGSGAGARRSISLRALIERQESPDNGRRDDAPVEHDRILAVWASTAAGAAVGIPVVNGAWVDGRTWPGRRPARPIQRCRPRAWPRNWRPPTPPATVLFWVGPRRQLYGPVGRPADPGTRPRERRGYGPRRCGCRGRPAGLELKKRKRRIFFFNRRIARAAHGV